MVESPSGKRYIGKTADQKKRRWSHFSAAKCYRYKSRFNAAIRRYGKKLKWHTLGGFKDEKVALAVEEFLIREFKTTDKRYGYNILPSGLVGYSAGPRTKEFKDNLSRQRSGEKNPMYGTKSPTRRKVLCLTTSKTFDSLTDAAREYGLTLGNVSNVCRSGGKTKGYAFAYADGK